MKACKFCKHGFIMYSHNLTPPCVYCYLEHGRYPEKKQPEHVCPYWEPDEEDEDEFETSNDSSLWS